MPFSVTQEALEALEWQAIMAILADCCRTPQARARTLGLSSRVDEKGAGGSTREHRPRDGTSLLFEATEHGARLRMLETSEARVLCDEDQTPPLGGAAEIDDALDGAGRGAVLDAGALLDVAGCARAIEETASFMDRKADTAPSLFDLASSLEPQPELVREIDRCIGPSGALLDAASPALSRARRATIRLGGELKSHMQRLLKSGDVTQHLSDTYFTLRNDRYVIPVRADARGAVRGIVHDASRSGTTLFVEPEGVVDLNNRLKQAELDVGREEERILAALSKRVSDGAEALRSSLEALTAIDLAFARGRLSQRQAGAAPRIGRDAIFELPGLRHPLLPPDDCVSNDLRVGEDFSVLVLSGPNAGGKTVSMKAVALAALFVRAGLHVPCEPGARVDLVDRVLVDIGDGQDISQSLSTFSAHMARLADTLRQAGEHTLIVLDEVGVGTDPAEGASLAQALLESLADRGARVLTTTHFNLLKEMAAARDQFENACVEFDPETLAPTYRVRLGAAGASSAGAVAARMGMPSEVLARADALLDREDRRLDQMLSELSANRAALEAEQARVSALRTESEATRDEFRIKLERLSAERDSLYARMRDDLDIALRDAHEQVASVIRELQRGPSAQQAARARSALQTIEVEADTEAERQGVSREQAAQDAREGEPIDWARTGVGDGVRVPGGGTGVIERLPDRRGRVRVRVGGARLDLPADRLTRSTQPASGKPAVERDRVRVVRADPKASEHTLSGGTTRCDLRGKRVDEAIDRLGSALDQAAAEGCDELVIVHGIGTGALRSAVREHLADSLYVVDIRAGDPETGGDGMTIASLGRNSRRG